MALNATFVALALCIAGSRQVAAAGVADTPLPQFSDGQPSQLVMTIPGVIKRDRLQTDFLCTSLANAPVNIGVEVFGASGALQNNVHVGQGAILNVNPGQTITFGTSATATYLETQVIPLGPGLQGSARIVATSNEVRCNVVVVDNLLTPPVSLGTLDEGAVPAAGALPPGFPLPQFANGHQATHAAVFPGVVDRGSLDTAFLCTSLATSRIDVGVEVFDAGGTIVNSIAAAGSAVLNVAPGATVTFSTTGTAGLVEDAVIATTLVAQGLARVVSNSGELRCTTVVLDSALAPPASMAGILGWGATGPGPGPTLPNPLPQFSDGKGSVHIMTVPGALKRDQLQTEIMCSSLDSVPVDIGAEIFAADGTLLNDINADVGAVLNVAPGQTVTIGTSATLAFLESTVIPLNNGLQGAARIVASSSDVRCNVFTVDDALTPPAALGVFYPGVAPVAGSAPGTLPLPQFSNGDQATHSLVVPGVVKRGNAETEFFCTSLAGGAIDIGVEVLNPNGTVANSIAGGNGAVLSVAPGSTVTIGTTGTTALLETTVISLAGVAQGLARVVSNSDQIICSALVLDAAGAPPAALSGLALYGVAGVSVPTPTPTPVPVCGNGGIEGGEQCDDGNTGGGDGCDAACQLECGALVSKGKIIVNKIDTPPGDDKLLFKGVVTFPSTVEPTVSGIRVLIEGGSGVVGDLSVAPGAGWTTNSALNKWTYIDASVKVTVKLNGPGAMKFKLKAQNGAFGLSAGDLPLTGFVVLAPYQCGQADFPGPAAPLCALNAAQSKVKCK